MNTRGFTLTEALVTTTVLAMGLAGVASLLSTCARAGQLNQLRIAAELSLVDKLAELRNHPAAAGEYSEALLVNSDRCTRSWIIQDDLHIRTVTLWLSRESSARSPVPLTLARISAGIPR